MYKKPFFEKCKVYWWGGFYIPVRNSISWELEQKHLTDKQKELYEKEFGEKVLVDKDFYKWLDKTYDTEGYHKSAA